MRKVGSGCGSQCATNEPLLATVRHRTFDTGKSLNHDIFFMKLLKCRIPSYRNLVHKYWDARALPKEGKRAPLRIFA